MKKFLLSLLSLLFCFVGIIPAFAGGNFTDNAEAEKYYCIGTPLLEAHRYREAIPSLEAATRTDTHYVAAFINLAMCYNHVGDFQQALRSASSALKYNDQSSYAFREKGVAERNLHLYKAAVNDFTKQIQFENGSAGSYYDRAVCQFCCKDYDQAISDFKHIIQANGWHEFYAPYAGICMTLSYRKQNKEAQAKTILEQCQKNLTSQAWPIPAIKYLARKINSTELLSSAKTVDEMTEARTYLGVDLIMQGKEKEGIDNLQWVVKNGNRSFLEYQIATTELENLKGQSIAKKIAK